MNRFTFCMTTSAIALAAGAAHGQNVTVTVENELSDGNFSFTPVWMALHDGSWNTYDTGSDAAMFPWLEPLAEGGMTMPVSDAFAAAQPSGSQTTLMENSGAPVFSPGETESTSLPVGDPTVNRWFSFASMVVPSNDLFIGNDSAMAYEVFDASGNFLGPIEILIFGEQVHDAGTELNDGMGAAFSTRGGTSTSEDVPIRLFFTDGGDQAYLDSFIGTGTADGGMITSSFGPDDLVARITIVPAPASLAVLGLGGLAAVCRRRGG